MNVSIVITRDYENERLSRRGENKPNTNPIEANFENQACRGDAVFQGFFEPTFAEAPINFALPTLDLERNLFGFDMLITGLIFG